jgi:hypothetical protein
MHLEFRTWKSGKRCLSLAFGFAQTGDPVAVFPLAALLEQSHALKTLEHVPFPAQSGGRSQTPML